MKNKFFESKYFIFCLLLIFALALVSLLREGYRFFQVSEEIRGLEEKIEDFRRENEELLEMKNIFNSQEFLEEEARKRLNMVKEGENVIIISDDSEIKQENTGASLEKISNIKLWIKYFFEK